MDYHEEKTNWAPVAKLIIIIVVIGAGVGWLQWNFNDIVAISALAASIVSIVGLGAYYIGGRNAERQVRAGAEIANEASSNAMYALSENLGNLAKLTSHVVKPHAEGAKSQRLQTQYDGSIRVLDHKAQLKQLELDDKEERSDAKDQKRALRIEAKKQPTWNDMFDDEEDEQGHDQGQGQDSYTYQSDTPASNVRYYD